MKLRFPIAFGSTRVRLVLLVTAILGLGGLVIGVRAGLNNHSPADAPAPAKDPEVVAVQSKSQATRLPSHVITLRPRGFDQAEVSWPKGRFFITIDNRTNVSEINLRLDRETGGRVKETKLKMRKERSLGVLDLTPGVYLLTEAGHPGWVCRIRITPQ
ncbi:MAG TPA: hypothetical protein VF791_10715 [Pyrinomonadaceae bacterium]